MQPDAQQELRDIARALGDEISAAVERKISLVSSEHEARYLCLMAFMTGVGLAVGATEDEGVHEVDVYESAIELLKELKIANRAQR